MYLIFLPEVSVRVKDGAVLPVGVIHVDCVGIDDDISLSKMSAHIN